MIYTKSNALVVKTFKRLFFGTVYTGFTFINISIIFFYIEYWGISSYDFRQVVSLRLFLRKYLHHLIILWLYSCMLRASHIMTLVKLSLLCEAVFEEKWKQKENQKYLFIDGWFLNLHLYVILPWRSKKVNS